MRSLPVNVAERDVLETVCAGWGIEFAEVRYVPEGAGAYHWLGRTAAGVKWFVTCDDLDTKPWLGTDREAVFVGLCAAYCTATDLRRAGRSFVVAPVPTPLGVVAAHVDDRHSVSVFEVVDGIAGAWGQPSTSEWRDELLVMLAELHRAPLNTPLRRGLDVPHRDVLVGALDDIDGLWEAGPLSEAARRALAPHVDTVFAWLAELDVLAPLAADATDHVVTHGEPHPGNLISTAHGLVLVDWDTVAMARPERDLWMLADIDETLVGAYERLTGVALDVELLNGFRRLWAVTDLAMYAADVMRAHTDNSETRRALAAIRSVLEAGEPLPFGPR